VTFVGKVGDDIFGSDMLANFEQEGVDTRYVSTGSQVASGVAVITIDASGRNTIIVASGANALLSAADVEAARSAIETAAVLVCQLEVPVEANLAAMRLARNAGKTVIFNPAPISGDVPNELFHLSHIVCPNETEINLLTCHDAGSLAEAETAARALQKRGAQRVIVTLGERGSLLVDTTTIHHVTAPQVTAVDTTGAGDAFMGSLAYLLAAGAPLLDAIDRANRIAAISVQSPGTQTSYPHAAQLPAELMAFS
jgi:ribokinase